MSAQNVELSVSGLFGPLLPAFPFKIKIHLQGGINTKLLNELMNKWWRLNGDGRGHRNKSKLPTEGREALPGFCDWFSQDHVTDGPNLGFKGHGMNLISLNSQEVSPVLCCSITHHLLDDYKTLLFMQDTKHSVLFTQSPGCWWTGLGLREPWSLYLLISVVSIDLTSWMGDGKSWKLQH